MGLERFLRQTDVVMPMDFPPITIIGAGGIGSFTTLALTKLGVMTPTVIDYDSIEDHNISNQLFGTVHMKLFKVDALKDVCNQLCDADIMTVNDKVNETSKILSKIIISGVDSMKARADIWKAIKNSSGEIIKPEYYIDARMGLEVIRLYTVNLSKDTKWYEDTLYSDSEAEMAPCTARAIIYTGFIVAGLIANQVKKLVKKEDVISDITFDVKNLLIVI